MKEKRMDFFQKKKNEAENIELLNQNDPGC
jgi:hypothetical protein